MNISVWCKKAFKLVLSQILFYSGLLDCYRKRKPKGILILRYHRIFADDKDLLYRIGIDKTNFDKQLQYLKENNKILTLDEAVDILKNKREIPDRAVVITFDDGYKDNWENAFPLLQKYVVPATIYITAGLIDTPDFLYWDRLREIISQSRKQEVNFVGATYKIKTRTEKSTAFQNILRELKKLDDKMKNKLLDDLETNLMGKQQLINQEDLLLSWDETLEMIEAGIDFGGHTVTHPLLTRVSPAQAREEIQGSKNIIEEKLACPVSTFAYPGGAFNPQIRQIVADSGYQAACSTILGINYHDCDLFALKRKGITDGSSTGLNGKFSRALFAVEISGFFDRLFKR